MSGESEARVFAKALGRAQVSNGPRFGCDRYLSGSKYSAAKGAGTAVPHLTVHVPESRLSGKERELVAALTEAVVEVYGEWARELVSVRIAGVPAGRFAQGGEVVDTGVSVTLGIRASVFERPDAVEITARLGAGLTDAVGRVLGEELRDSIMVELVASPAERTFVGGRRAE